MEPLSMPKLHPSPTSRERGGFTLIELLIVVAIIAILAAIAVPNFLEAQTRAKVSRAKADMRSIATALGAYRVDGNRYPPGYARQDGTLKNPIGTANGIDGVGNGVNPRIQRLAWITTPVAYMTSIQNDPFSVSNTEPDPLNKQFPVFTYWDDRYFDARKANGTAPTDFIDFPSQIGVKSEYALMSYGPDQIFHPAAFFPNLRNYDATNGTVSAGDIYRFGGEIP